MRFLFLLLAVAAPFFVQAQGDRQDIALQGARVVQIFAAFSSVSVTTGGTDAVSVHHVLTADGEDRPELRKLEIDRENGILRIREVLPTAELLEREFGGKGVETYQSDEGGKNRYWGVKIDATLKIVVPAGILISVETVYGGIAVTNVGGLQQAKAKYGALDIVFGPGTRVGDLDLYSNYGAVDLTLPPGQAANLDITTEYGELLSDLDLKLDTAASEEKDYYQRVIARINGGGTRVQCRAPYGNVYLRKAK
ncbi:hypothetical protein QWY85_19890 [Neolewinella lacunae]|uniref:Adhesin domain-containing protein n=1 Tax=Neolewinella lacunae TaxID=1517758 RepID=A0A923PRT4_9BACT|nr:hypothetical protein [Neolewinella lacunae]MBC6996319.1 hypothetical protein [Neolewinella lacunae]MDN3636942.1 hypothetical protein [Neolewinella lacunae]